MNGPVVEGAYAARFHALWQRCSVGTAAVDSARIHADLRTRYAEPQRHYHRFAHIEHCLREFDGALARDPPADEIEMAVWFHDVVYVPGATNNEQRSADWFAHYGHAEMASAFVDRVCELIMITTHRRLPEGIQQAWVTDIDLSSFGLPWPQFLRDTRHVRAEQAELSDAAYYAAQGRFLRGLCARADFSYGLFPATLPAVGAR